MRAVRDFNADSFAAAGFFKNLTYISKLSYFNNQSNNSLIASINCSHPLHLHTIGLVIGQFTLHWL